MLFHFEKENCNMSLKFVLAPITIRIILALPLSLHVDFVISKLSQIFFNEIKPFIHFIRMTCPWFVYLFLDMNYLSFISKSNSNE